jgi:hypothetical protein
MQATDTGDISNFVRNGEWMLESLSVAKHVKVYSCCENPFPDITYYVIMFPGLWGYGSLIQDYLQTIPIRSNRWLYDDCRSFTHST